MLKYRHEPEKPGRTADYNAALSVLVDGRTRRSAWVQTPAVLALTHMLA